MNSKPQIHVVEDDNSLRTALLRQITAAGFNVTGYASTGDFLLHRPANHHGCVLLDVRLPGPSGLDLQEALQHQGIDMPVVFMTGHADVASCVRAMKAGAVDFLEKPIDPTLLLDALKRALALDLQQRSARHEGQQLRSSFASLSHREREVFDRVVAGRLNKQIADELGIAERTVKAQRAQVMVKLGVGSAAELGRFAERMSHAGDKGSTVPMPSRP